MGRPPKSSALSFWEHLRAFPPPLVRLTARRVVSGRKVVWISGREVAIASGIPLARVEAISRGLDWATVSVGEAEAFCRACEFDPTSAPDRERQQKYIRTCQRRRPSLPPPYLSQSPYWSTEIRPLIQHLKSQQPSPTASEPSAFPARSCAA